MSRSAALRAPPCTEEQARKSAASHRSDGSRQPCLKAAISGSDGRVSYPDIIAARSRVAVLAVTSPVRVLRAGLRHNAD